MNHIAVFSVAEGRRVHAQSAPVEDYFRNYNSKRQRRQMLDTSGRRVTRTFVLVCRTFPSTERGSTGMTLPATAADSNSGTRHIPASGPISTENRALGKLLTDAATDPRISDANYRFLTVVIMTFGVEVFTTAQIAEATGLTLHGAGHRLKALADVGLVTGRRKAIGTTDDGRQVRTRIYKLAGVAA